MIQQKIHAIQKLLRAQERDMLIIGNLGHQIHDDLLYYLLLTHLELGLMLIPRRGKPTLYAIPFEVTELARSYKEIRVLPFDKPMKDLLPKDKTLCFRPSALPASHLSYLSTHGRIPLADEELCMAIKLPEEQKRMKQAGKITDNIFASVIEEWHTFATERDVSTFILKQCLEYGVEPSFAPIVASGRHAANPHHHPSATPLRTGFCVIDMGVRYRGYCSDMTRTIYIGSPSNTEKKIYEHIWQAQERAVQSCVAGALISDIAKQCRDDLGKTYNRYFTHALGHGLGTQVHEWPRVSIKEDVYLEEGMVITIEPGVYIPNKWGIRIEDDILITKQGRQMLTNTAKVFIRV